MGFEIWKAEPCAETVSQITESSQEAQRES